MAKPVPSSDFPEVIKDLRAAISDMDSLSQDGFSEISAVAQLALESLEHPGGYLRMETIAQALSAIWSKAQNVEDCINARAESVGCNYIDDAQRRRWAAESAARQKQAAGEA